MDEIFAAQGSRGILNVLITYARDFVEEVEMISMSDRLGCHHVGDWVFLDNVDTTTHGDDR